MSRREIIQRHRHLEEVSPEVGMLDEDALARRFDDDPDGAVALLVDLARATDPELRRRARALGSRVLIPMTRRSGPGRSSGAVRLVTSRKAGLDLDIDAAVEAVAGRSWLAPEDLRWRRWERPGRAYILLVDASGSVAGSPLTTAVVTAAALAGRCGPQDELAVVAFWSRAVVLRAVTSLRPHETVLDALFDLRGGDMTDLAAGLRTALAQAELCGAGRRDILLLTDGMATAGDDPVPVAATAGASGAAVHVLALVDEPEANDACRRIAEAGGGHVAMLLRPSDAPAAIAEVLA
ncbi:MAG: VWA domain-containing protein [Acidimicrobiales bacterium]